MRRPLPPELVDLGDELERTVRRRVVDGPRRRQLALGILSTFVITVPMAISLTGAELARPTSQLDGPSQEDRPTPPSGPATTPIAASPAAVLLPQGLPSFTIAAIPTPYPTETRRLRPNLP